MNTKINYKRILGAIILSLPFLAIWYHAVYTLGPTLAVLPFIGAGLIFGFITLGVNLIFKS